MIRAKLPSPEMLKNGFMILLNSLPKCLGIFVWDRTSVAIKKGKREGITEFAHSFRPDFAACRLVEENRTRHRVNSRNRAGIRFLFSLNTNMWNFFMGTPLGNLYDGRRDFMNKKFLIGRIGDECKLLALGDLR